MLLKSFVHTARNLAATALMLATVALPAPPAWAVAEIQFWHAMSGERGREVEKLVTDFNNSQADYRIVPVFKGLYTETMTAALFAVRIGQHPAIVQVAEVGTATMMAARGAVYPVFDLMRAEQVPFDESTYLSAIAGYYTDLRGNMLSYPFNSSTPILYYNKEQFRIAGLDPDVAPKTWPDVEAAAHHLRAAGIACGFTTEWPSWINVENFSAFHNIPLATNQNGLGGLDAELKLTNPLLVGHIAALAEWQKTKLFDYGGRANRAERKFYGSECGIFLGSSAARADILANAKFDVGYGMLPYWPDLTGVPQNSIIGGGSLWVLKERPREEYAGVAKFFAFLSRPEVQAGWHQATGYLPITRAAYELTQSQGYYERNPGTDTSIKQITLHPPTPNSLGLRLGSFVLVREIIESELEQAFAGSKSARGALEAALSRGNDVLRRFEQTNR